MATKYTFRIFYLIILIKVTTAESLDGIGCYEMPIDPVKHGIRNPGQYNTDTITITECMGLCKQLLSQYTLLTNGEVCQCSDTLPNDPVEDDNFCSASCPGSCGGEDHYTAFETQPKLGNIGIYYKSNVFEKLSEDDIYREQNQVIVPALTNLTFATNFTGTENIELSLNFGDNYPFADEVFQSPADFNHLFIQPLLYPITGVAVDNETREMVAVDTIVKAVMPVFNISMVCPKIVGANHPFECLVTIMLGTSLLMEADYEVGNLTMVPNDASHIIYGISNWDEPYQKTVAGYRHYFDQVRFDGILLSWEFHVALIGTFVFEVYRPTPIPSFKNCTEGSYLFAKRRCSLDNNVPGSFTVEQVHQFEYTAESTGKHYVIADDKLISVMKGDMLTVSSANGELLYTSYNKSHKEFFSTIDSSTPTDVHAHNTLVQVTIAVSSHVKVQMQLPDPTDSDAEDSDRVIFVNVKNALSAENTSTHVHIQSYINGIEIVGPPYQTTNESVTLTIPPHNGTDIIYSFNFGNGDDILTTESSTVQYTWMFAGIYTVTVTASNYVSEDTNTFVIHIEDPVSHEISWVKTLPQPRQPERAIDVTNVTEASLIRWSVPAGTDYSVDVVLGDTEKFNLSAPTRGFTSEDEVLVDGVTLKNIVLMNEGACLNPLPLETSDGTQIDVYKVAKYCLYCSSLEIKIDLKRISTVLGIITTGYSDQRASSFEVSYSNDNSHFVPADQFVGGSTYSNLTTVFKNAFIARYLSLNVTECSSGCGMALHVLGCEWSPVCQDQLTLVDNSTETICSQLCNANFGELRTMTGVIVRSDISTSFTIQYSVDDVVYLDLIDRSGDIVTFNSSVLFHLFPESVIAQHVKILRTDSVTVYFTILGCEGSRVCSNAFGMESGVVASDSVTHSSDVNASFNLNGETFSSSSDYWVAVDLGKAMTVTGVVTQGCTDLDSDQGTFTIEYRGHDDNWLTVYDSANIAVVFTLNTDRSMNLHHLPYPIIARHFKMDVSSSSCMHFEPVGCFSPLICQTSLADQSTYKKNSEVLMSAGSCWNIDAVEWILIDLGIQRSVTSIITKYLLDFRVEYSQEMHNWISVVDDDAMDKV